MIAYNESTQVVSTIIYCLALIASFIISAFLKDKDKKTKKIPLFIIGAIILILEIGKQIRNFSGYQYKQIFAIFKGTTNDFDPYALPFHFCSFFIFWVIFQFVFMKSEKLSFFFDNMAFLWATFISVLMIFYPQMIYGDEIQHAYENGEIYHSVYFHSLVLMYWVIAIALKIPDFKLKKFYHGPICMLIFGAIAIPAAHILKQNYCSIYSAEGWGFLEPVFAMGYVVYDGLLIVIGFVVSLILYFSIAGVEKLRNSIKFKEPFKIGWYVFAGLLVVLLIISIATGFTKLEPLYSIYIVGLMLVCQLPAICINIFKKA